MSKASTKGMDKASTKEMDEASTKPKGNKDDDVVLVHGRTEDGEGLRALRSHSDSLSMVELRPLKEGKPLRTGEIVSISPREESPLLFNVKIQHQLTASPVRVSGGPTRIATRTYRQNWQKIFGSGRSGGDDWSN